MNSNRRSSARIFSVVPPANDGAWGQQTSVVAEEQPAPTPVIIKQEPNTFETPPRGILAPSSAAPLKRAAQPTAPDADAAPKRRLLPERLRGDGAPGADYDAVVMSEEPPLPPAVHDLCSSPPQRTPALPTNGTGGMEAYTSENIRSVQLEAKQLDETMQLSTIHAAMQLSTKEASPSKAAEQADTIAAESFRVAQDLEPVRMDMALQLAEIQREQSEADARGREHDREEATAEEVALYTSMDNQLVLTARADAARRSADTKKVSVAAYYVDMEAAIKLVNLEDEDGERGGSFTADKNAWLLAKHRLVFADVTAFFREHADHAIQQSCGRLPSKSLRAFIALSADINDARTMQSLAEAKLRRDAAVALQAEYRRRFFGDITIAS